MSLKLKMKKPYDSTSLEKMGFYYSKSQSDKDTSIYVKKTSVYRYNDAILLEVWFRLNYKTCDVIVDVMDVYNGMHGKYGPWYYYEYGDYTPILEEINEKINKEMKKCNLINKKNKGE